MGHSNKMILSKTLAKPFSACRNENERKVVFCNNVTKLLRGLFNNVQPRENICLSYVIALR